MVENKNSIVVMSKSGYEKSRYLIRDGRERNTSTKLSGRTGLSAAGVLIYLLWFCANLLPGLKLRQLTEEEHSE